VLATPKAFASRELPIKVRRRDDATTHTRDAHSTAAQGKLYAPQCSTHAAANALYHSTFFRHFQLLTLPLSSCEEARRPNPYRGGDLRTQVSLISASPLPGERIEVRGERACRDVRGAKGVIRSSFVIRASSFRRNSHPRWAIDDAVESAISADSPSLRKLPVR
jgi:hypothetical protein